MHELALTQSIVDMVAERLPGRTVASVRVEVGALCGVVPDAMQFCFELAASGTLLAEASLVVDEVPGRVSCRSCGTDSDLPDLVRLCPCGSADVAVVSGQELRVVSVELVTEPAPAEEGACA